MEEIRERKLHPVIEGILIAGIMLGCHLLYATVLYFYAQGKSISEIMKFNSILGWISWLYPVVATFLCVKVIEKKTISYLKVLSIVLCVTILSIVSWKIVQSYFYAYGDEVVRSFTYVQIFLRPCIDAALITLFVNIFNMPKVEASLYDKKMYCSLWAHILLLFFTFGIWFLVWVFRVTTYLNCAKDEDYRNPATKLLLCMFVPFYAIYWTYKSAQRIDKLAKSVGIVSDLTTPCLILEFFVPIVPPILMQDKINKILETSNIQA